MRILAILLLLACAPAFAATVPWTPTQIVEHSDAVVDVRVVGAHSAWVGTRIITFVDVAVLDAWKAPAAHALPARLVVGVPGGVVGDIEQRVPGAPVLRVGQRYVLCLGTPTGPNGARIVVGFDKGTYAVDETNGALSRARIRATLLKAEP